MAVMIVIGFGLMLWWIATPEEEPQVHNQFTDTIVGLYDVPRFEEYTIPAYITFYTPRPEETDDTPYHTASGERVREGIIACPNWLNFGDKVIIDGQSYACEDRMNERYRDGRYFDIFTFDLEEALAFGRQEQVVNIIKFY